MMILYDIESNRFRGRIAKVLLGRGAVRIQKSVYFFQGDIRIFNPTRVRLEKWMIEFAEPGDKLYMVPISQTAVERIVMMGLKMDIELLMGKGLIFL